MRTLLRQPDSKLLTHTTVIQLKDGNVGTRILLVDIDLNIIGSLYMYADEDAYHHDPSETAAANNWLNWTRTVKPSLPLLWSVIINKALDN